MKRKFTIISIALCIISLFFISYTFANTNDMKNAAGGAVNTVRNVIGGTENAVEGAANSATGAIKNGMNSVENGAENMVNGTNNGLNEMKNDTTDSMMGANNGGTNSYTATRTSTTNNNLFGLSSSAWTWIILAIAAIGIIALVMFYTRQNNTTNIYKDKDNK